MDPTMSLVEEDTPICHVLIVDQDRFATLIEKMLPESYIITSVSDGLEAIRQLQQDLPDLLLIEETVPGNGNRLAELVGMTPHLSHIPIVLMSVRPSPEGIIRARNAGINTYLAKPFRPSELRRRIDAIFGPRVSAIGAEQAKPTAEGDTAQREAAGQEIRDRIKQIEGLPSFPATHAQILELAQSADSSSENIAEQIQMDPSLLASVFKIANSSAYGFQRKVDSLKLAVTLLGLEEIANLVMTAQVFKSLGNYHGAGLDLESFWRHAVGTAFITRAIARKLQTEVESAFLAGMLHDLGKIVLDRCFPDYYRMVLQQAEDQGQWLFDAEKQVLGLTHVDVGTQLAIEWKFAEKYLCSIQYHHAPNMTVRYQRLVSLVHIADIMCRKIGFGSGGDACIPDYCEEVLERFALGERGLQILQETAQADLEDAEAFLGALASG